MLDICQLKYYLTILCKYMCAIAKANVKSKLGVLSLDVLDVSDKIKLLVINLTLTSHFQFVIGIFKFPITDSY